MGRVIGHPIKATKEASTTTMCLSGRVSPRVSICLSLCLVFFYETRKKISKTGKRKQKNNYCVELAAQTFQECQTSPDRLTSAGHGDVPHPEGSGEDDPVGGLD